MLNDDGGQARHKTAYSVEMCKYESFSKHSKGSDDVERQSLAVWKRAQ